MHIELNVKMDSIEHIGDLREQISDTKYKIDEYKVDKRYVRDMYISGLFAI